MGWKKDMVKKLGFQYALDQTLAIAKHLPNKQNIELYKKTVQSIFDDHLQRHTWFNRSQRRAKVSELVLAASSCRTTITEMVQSSPTADFSASLAATQTCPYPLDGCAARSSGESRTSRLW